MTEFLLLYVFIEPAGIRQRRPALDLLALDLLTLDLLALDLLALDRQEETGSSVAIKAAVYCDLINTIQTPEPSTPVLFVLLIRRRNSC